MQINQQFGFASFQSVTKSKSVLKTVSNSGQQGWFNLSAPGMENFKTNERNASFFSAQSFVSVASVQITRMSVVFGGFTGGSHFEKTAVSGDTSALEIKSFGGKEFEDKNVLIEQLATAQKNAGKMMNVNANPGTQKNGVYTFEIEIGGEIHKLSFDVDHKETNKTFQQKMADAINSANIGITAYITTDADGKNSALNLDGKETGVGFAIRDVLGNAVALTGIGNVSQQAQNAIFSINGGEKQTSKTNVADLGNGITAALLKASEKPVPVTFVKDTKAMHDGIHNMCDCFNKMWEAANGNQNDRFTGLFMKSFSKTVSMSVTVLKSIGVNADAEGFLSADSAKVWEAATNGTIEKFFWGEKPAGRDFFEQFNTLFDRFTRNPWQFVHPNFKRWSMMNMPNAVDVKG